MKTITLTLTEGIVTSKKEITEEQANAVREILKEEPKGKWVPKLGEEYYFVTSHGGVRCDVNDEFIENLELIAQNNVFLTEEQAEAESLRREGSERRYLPEDGEEYKTLNAKYGTMSSEWDNDMFDMLRYHNGLVWSIETPVSEILPWLKKYRKAWETK